jgi:pilus assembly protein CpaF
MAADRLAADGHTFDRTYTRARPDAHVDLVHQLDGQVRERVRREGVDPQREAVVVRRIAEDVVRDHDQLSLTGAVAPIADDGAMVGELVARVSGFGPLQPFLDDPEVEEVWINDPSRVFIARRGRHELTNLRLDVAQVNELVERMLKSSGRRLDISTPFVDAMLPEGHRLHVVLEGITRGFTAVNIRKFLLRAHRLSDLVALGSMTSQAARFLEASVRAGLNILVAGGTQAGKTTMLNCLAAAVPGGERVVSAEEVFELRFSHPDWVAMQTRQAGLEQTGEIVLRDLVKEALRMRPSRILVGEVRAAECLDLLLALNSGLPGMCTLHANSAREALMKMCTLPLLAGDNISARFVVPTVATSVDLVVHLGVGADGVRRVNEIVSVPGRVEADVIEVEPIFVRGASELRRTGGVPARVERYERVGIDIHEVLAVDRGAGEL